MLTEPAQPALSPTDAALLTDLIAGDKPFHSIAADHKLTLADFLAWVRLPRIQDAIQDLQDLQQLQLTIVASRARLATIRLLHQQIHNIKDPVELRRAANTLLRAHTPPRPAKTPARRRFSQQTHHLASHAGGLTAPPFPLIPSLAPPLQPAPAGPGPAAERPSDVTRPSDAGRPPAVRPPSTPPPKPPASASTPPTTPPSPPAAQPSKPTQPQAPAAHAQHKSQPAPQRQPSPPAAAPTPPARAAPPQSRASAA